MALSELRLQLRQGAISHADGRTSFWPLGVLKRILTEEHILEALRDEQHTSIITNREFLAERVSTTFIKIFAILILMERVSDIILFLQYNLRDEDLPFEFRATPSPGLFKGDRELEPFREWRDFELEYFNQTQWRLLIPFLEPPTQESMLVDYAFPPNTILPWIPTHSEDKGLDVTEGGFAQIHRVKIEESCHGFGPFLEKMSLSAEFFAVKTFFSEAEAHFRQEIKMVETLNARRPRHRHIISPLATFSYDNKYSLLLPYAEYDLYTFWESHDGPLELSAKAADPNVASAKVSMLWFAQQITGIAEALTTIHNVGPAYNPDQRFGRHGDIKPDNILCFRSTAENKGEYMLVLADFGASSFNRESSRSNIPGHKVICAPGYRPPECEIRGGVVSRSFDIWTFGCLLIEMCAWVLGGIQEVESFAEKRLTPTILGYLSSVFFSIVMDEKEKEQYKPSLKDEVVQYISYIHSHKSCTQYIHDIVQFVADHMLLVEVREGPLQIRRSGADVVFDHLSLLLEKAVKDTSYLVEPCPRDIARADTQAPVRVAYNTELAVRDSGYEYRQSVGARWLSGRFQRGRHRRTVSVRLKEQNNDQTDLEGFTRPRTVPWKSDQTEYPPPVVSDLSSQIDTAVSGHGSTQTYKISITAHWELRRCIQEEFDGDTELGEIATISGKRVSQGWVTTCAEYVEYTWGEFGKDLLLDLQGALVDSAASKAKSTGTKFDLEASEEPNAPAVVSYSGSMERSKALCGFISWIAAVFRVPRHDKLQVSTVEFSRLPKNLDQSDYTFQVTLKDVTEVDDEEPGACWASLFPSMVMAIGFAVPEMPETKGVLMPFDQMLELADILCDVNLEDEDGKYEGVYLDGVSYILYPTAYILDTETPTPTVQWHLKKKRGQATDQHRSLAPDNGSGHWLRGKTLEELSRARAVLGYCPEVVTQLGTRSREPLFNQFRYSLASPHDPPPEVSLMGLTSSISLKGFANIGTTGTVKYPKRNRVFRKEEKDKEYAEVLDDAKRGWVILFETAPGEERAWMVSQLSLMLELYNFWAFKRGIAGIRYASAGPSGVHEAERVLNDGAYVSTIVVPAMIPSDKGLCVGDIIKRIYNRIDARIAETAGTSQGDSSTSRNRIRLGKGGIVGWDWLELAGAPSVSDEKTKKDFPDPCWKPFTTGLRIPVFMGQNLGQVITPRDNRHPLCNNCNPVPGGAQHNYLVATVASIRALAQLSGQPQDHERSCWRFSDKLSWDLTDGGLFLDCTPLCIANPTECRKKAQVLNTKRKRRTLVKVDRPEWVTTRNIVAIQENGAVIFGTG